MNIVASALVPLYIGISLPKDKWEDLIDSPSAKMLDFLTCARCNDVIPPTCKFRTYQLAFQWNLLREDDFYELDFDYRLLCSQHNSVPFMYTLAAAPSKGFYELTKLLDAAWPDGEYTGCHVEDYLIRGLAKIDKKKFTRAFIVPHAKNGCDYCFSPQASYCEHCKVVRVCDGCKKYLYHKLVCEKLIKSVFDLDHIHWDK